MLELQWIPVRLESTTPKATGSSDHIESNQGKSVALSIYPS